ncbi:MAG TPA: hypothetical protein VGK19_11260 [Capsulimonadaceae bacterium]|jgi:hypothetical protein
MISAVSSGGTLQFSERQLWFEFHRRKVPQVNMRVTMFVLAGVCVPTAIVLAAVGSPAFAALATLGAIGCGVRGALTSASPQRLVRISFEAFHDLYVATWVHTHGKIAGMLDEPKPRTGATSPASADLLNYSFDRAIVTDDQELARVLVANNFHFENNCAILSYDGYPAHNRTTIMTMLRKNPTLNVFTVHAASIKGCMLPHMMRTSDWFADCPDMRIIDLGLRPKHAIKGKMFSSVPERTGVPPTLAALEPDEVKWLETGYKCEIFNMRSARLLKSIYKGMNAARLRDSAGSSDDGVVYVGSNSGGDYWGDTSSSDLGAPDSFG